MKFLRFFIFLSLLWLLSAPTWAAVTTYYALGYSCSTTPRISPEAIRSFCGWYKWSKAFKNGSSCDPNGAGCLFTNEYAWDNLVATAVIPDSCSIYATFDSSGIATCVSSCPIETNLMGALCVPTAICTPPSSYDWNNTTFTYSCNLPPCTAGEVKEGYAPTSGTQRYDNCNYELNPNEPSKEIYSGVSTGVHGTWVNTGVSNPGDNTLTVPGSPETPCEGLDCCLDMTEGQGYEGELAFLYCEEFWTEENKSTESYYKY